MKITSLLSVSLTTLLIGAGLTYWCINNQVNTKLSNREFLEARLKSISQPEDSSAAIRRLPVVRVDKAQLRPIANESRFDGRLVEIQKVVVASEVSGLIRQMPVEVGDKVKQSTSLIVDVDTTWLDIALIQALRQKEVNQVNMTLQKAELDRVERLVERQKGVITESDLEKQRALAEESVAQFKLSEAAENEIREKLARTKIYAPFNGSIIKKIAELGGYVSPGTPLVEIVSDGQIDALFNIGENYIDRVKIGNTLNVNICPLNETVEGRIVSVVPYGATAARSFPVRVRLDDKTGKFKVGMSVQCILNTTDTVDHLCVVKNAVLQKPGDTTVWIVQKDQDNSLHALPIPVYIHAKDKGFIAICPATEAGKQQLAADTPVIIEGAERLTPNQQVTIKDLNPYLLKDLPTAAGMQTFSHQKEN